MANENQQNENKKDFFNKKSVALSITEEYRKKYEPESPKIAPLNFEKAYKFFRETDNQEVKKTFFGFLAKGKIAPISISNWDEKVLKSFSSFFKMENDSNDVESRIEAMVDAYKKWLTAEFPEIDFKKINKLTAGRIRISELYNMLAYQNPKKNLPNFYGMGIKNPTKQNMKALDGNALSAIEQWLKAS